MPPKNNFSSGLYSKKKTKKLKKQADEVNHPSHYNTGKIEVIEFLEDQRLSFHRANAVKYIARAGKKSIETEFQDIQKAIWYLKRDLELLSAYEKKLIPCRPNEMKK
jgi:hypothetical protein